MSGGLARVREHRARRSVRRKLLVVALITTAIALAVAGISLLTRDLNAYRHGLALDLQTEASILALSTGPALAFDDHATASRNVAALSARPAVLVAAIYTADGRLYAQYVRPGERAAPPRAPSVAGGMRFTDGHIEITHRIAQKGEWLGTIYLRGRYDATGRVETYLGILALVGLLSLGVALGLSGVLQRSITGPLSAMAAIAQRIVRERDYSLRAPGSAEDEIGLVVEAFNNMLDEVQSRAHDLEQSNSALTREVESRQAAEAALKEADRRKDEFLATLAHELRNPLAPIRHCVKLLELPGTDERRREWCREVIGRQVQRMALLLDDLLDVSRITRGRLELRKSRVELTAVTRSAVETARPLIESKRHALELRLPAEPIEVEADPLRLSQALSNLLTNAAKYTDAGGRITLGAELTAADLRLSVSDTGIGLAAASIPTLFEMFSQVDSAIDRAEGGLGIGLALVKGLIGLHGGTVDASSEGPGRGSTFTIHLPRGAVTRHLPAGAATAAQSAAAQGPRCAVLIADDNRDAADSLALLLDAAGYTTHVAHSGREALALAQREHPDVLVLDIGMPDLTGYEVAQRIRGEDWGRRAMLLAVTGWGQQEDKARAAAAGFDHHLTKPVAPDEVEAL
ncbi:MAG: ATP-binding protein, partial [Steroidobacteraceae bacterium]